MCACVNIDVVEEQAKRCTSSRFHYVPLCICVFGVFVYIHKYKCCDGLRLRDAVDRVLFRSRITAAESNKRQRRQEANKIRPLRVECTLNESKTICSCRAHPLPATQSSCPYIYIYIHINIYIYIYIRVERDPDDAKRPASALRRGPFPARFRCRLTTGRYTASSQRPTPAA